MSVRNILLVLSLGLSSLACAQSAYINKVYEYKPAPGQFINVLPTYTEGDSEADMIAKVEQKIVGKVGNTNYICLGAWGGYVTFGFDHPLVNVAGEYDLLVYGNSFVSGEKADGIQYGSSEPGVIYVSRDENGDGLPNDTWYEIAGSMASESDRLYQLTYTNAGEKEDVPWVDNRGENGYVYHNIYHQQSYYPLWYADATVQFSGTLLPSNLDAFGNACIYGYGYADNWPNDDERAKIKLDWAVDADGMPANLPYVDFIRVQTGVLVDWGMLGEMSTEVCGAEDLHPQAPVPSVEALDGVVSHETEMYIRDGQLRIRKNGRTYSVLGYSW